jgi:hypothetical protein
MRLPDGNPPETVAAYFERVLGAKLEPGKPHCPPEHAASPSHPSFTIDTACGEECVAAIDAAAPLQGHARLAFGERYDAQLIDITRHIVLCYIYG